MKKRYSRRNALLLNISRCRNLKMILGKLILPTLLLLQFSHGGYLFETNAEFHLKNEHLEIHISKKTGNINAIIAKGKNLLSQNGTVNINIHSEKCDGKIVKIEGEDHYPQFARVYFKEKWAEISLEHQFIIDSLALRWEAKILTKENTEQEVNIDFNIPVMKYMDYIFYPASEAPFKIEDIEEKKLTYRRNLYMPIITAYNSIEDYGLSFIAPLETPKPGLSFLIDKEMLTVSYSHVRLTSKQKSKAAIYIVPHQGDWRPGLAFLLNRYPEYFYPKVENTKIGEGWYYLGWPFDKETTVKEKRECNVKWVELHGHFPFYGLYVPEPKDWGLIISSDKTSLNDWEKGADDKRNSYKNMQNLINIWHKYGIQVYLYFQSFDAWHQYAEKYFTNDIARNKSDTPHSAWKFCNLMNPDPSNKWGKHIVNQAEDLIKKYPDVDGIFYDRMDYWKYDFAHDDGITRINDRPAYMLGFALEKINETIFDIFHKNKKGIWGNIPTSIEVCKNLDGIMSESNPLKLYKIQYMGLVRPIIYLVHDSKLKITEAKLKNSLTCGAFPSITYGDLKFQKLDAKYRPLFDIIKNREWVLSKKPIEIPDGFKGNIFRTPEGDYVAIIMSPEKSQLFPHPFEYNIPVTVNVPDANKINYVYLLSGDWGGINSLDFKTKGKTIKINLPYHLSSSLIYLTKMRKYNLVRFSSPVFIRDKDENLIFQVENFANKNQSVIEIQTSWFKEKKIITSDVVKFQTTIPRNIEGEIEIIVNYNGKNYRFTNWIVDPISIMPKEDIFIHEKEQNVPFIITNNLSGKIVVELTGNFVNGNGKIKTPNKITLQPFEHKNIYFIIAAKNEGKINITLKADDQKFVQTFLVKAGLFQEKSDLFFDDFRQGMKGWIINRGTWSVSNGIANGSGSSHFAFVKNNGWQNYIFEVTTRCRGSDNPAVDWFKSYIFFRVKDEKNLYRFGLHGDIGVIDLYKKVDGKWTALGSSLFLPKKDNWYTLRIQVKGTKIIGYINGEKIIKINDNTFSSGGIGIGVLEDGMRCDYKNIIVKNL